PGAVPVLPSTTPAGTPAYLPVPSNAQQPIARAARTAHGSARHVKPRQRTTPAATTPPTRRASTTFPMRVTSVAPPATPPAADSTREREPRAGSTMRKVPSVPSAPAASDRQRTAPAAPSRMPPVPPLAAAPVVPAASPTSPTIYGEPVPVLPDARGAEPPD